MLITSRVLQGAFGAVLVPQGFGVIKMMFPAKELGLAFGLFGPVIGLSAVCGPILAGSLIDADLWGTGWRMIFLINVPLGLLAIAGAVRFMPESRSRRRPRLDVPGMVLVTTASLLLIFPLVQGREYGWPLWTYALMVGSLPVFVAFVWYERRRTSSPLVEPALFARRAYTGGLAVIAAYFAAVAGLMLVFGVFTQVGLGFSPLRSGTGHGAVGARHGRRRRGQRRLPGATVRPAHHPRWTDRDGGGVRGHCRHRAPRWRRDRSLGSRAGHGAVGIGMGLSIAPLFSVILAAVNDDEVGTASGVLNAVQQFGGAVGIAVLGTIFFDQIGGGQFTAAMRGVAWIAAGLMVLAFALAFLMPKQARPETG